MKKSTIGITINLDRTDRERIIKAYQDAEHDPSFLGKYERAERIIHDNFAILSTIIEAIVSDKAVK